jgi:NDP-sugar pyrophosphorylase family protein
MAMVVCNKKDKNNSLDVCRQEREYLRKDVWNRFVNVENKNQIRLLKDNEQTILEEDCHVRCDDWSNVWLCCDSNKNDDDDDYVEKVLKEHRILTSSFLVGRIVLVVDKDSIIRNNDRLEDVILDAKCHVCYNHDIRHSYIQGAVTHTHHLSYDTTTSTTNDDTSHTMTITVGAESGGGRPITVHPESSMIDTTHQLYHPNSNDNYHHHHHHHHHPLTLKYNVILGKVVNCPYVENVYVGKGAMIEGATHVKHAVLLSSSSSKDGKTYVGKGCHVDHVYMQWGVSIDHNCKVDRVMLMEASHVGPNSVVQHSLLGPDCAVSCGEIHASFLGPHVVSHHQSLLISVLWPAGRGNVGYGANVGSNHTGRLPDQECISSEGTFWGLSSVIVYPINIHTGLYSLIAANTKLSPSFVLHHPFSLVMTDNNTSTTIIPGWVYWNSPYTLVRNEFKYQTRTKAQRHFQYYTNYPSLFYRPSIVNSCFQSYLQLTTSNNKNNSSITQRAQQTGIKAYKHYLQRFAFHLWFQHHRSPTWKDLTKQIIMTKNNNGHSNHHLISTNTNCNNNNNNNNNNNDGKIQWCQLPWEDDDDQERIALAIQILHHFQFLNSDTNDDDSMICQMLHLEQEFVQRVILCKKRDESRGNKTIPGYQQSHVPYDKDPVIIMVNKNYNELQQQAQQQYPTSSSSNHRSRL